METIIFKENQKVKQAWVWGLVIFISLLFLVFFISGIFLNIEIGNNPAPDWALWVLLIIPFLLWFLLLGMQLQTEITEDSIRYCLKPFMRNFKVIRKSEVKSLELIKYNPLKDYTGWGYRYHSTRKGSRAISISGSYGLSIEFINGTNFLIGTKRPKELSEAIKNLNL